MSKCVMKIEGWANGVRSAFEGLYIVHFDFDHPITSTFSRDVTDAKVFDSVGDAINYRNTVSSIEPVRSTDGEPNRPLTAFNVSVRPV